MQWPTVFEDGERVGSSVTGMPMAPGSIVRSKLFFSLLSVTRFEVSDAIRNATATEDLTR